MNKDTKTNAGVGVVTTNPNAMTLDQCRDWLARAFGWGFPGDRGVLLDGTIVTLTQYHRTTQVGSVDKRSEHPIEPTLDEIAGCLPFEYALDCVRERPSQPIESRWFASAQTGTSEERPAAEGDTEILARARLAVLCLIAITAQAEPRVDPKVVP